MYVQGI